MSCVLCDNAVRNEVRVLLAEWRDPEEVGERWSAVPRCDDRAACRGRVEARNERWPLVEEARER